MVLVVKNTPASSGDVRDPGSIPGSGRSPGGGHGNPLQYSCLENNMDRQAWQATVHGVVKSQTRLKRLSTYTQCSSHVDHGRVKHSRELGNLLGYCFMWWEIHDKSYSRSLGIEKLETLTCLGRQNVIKYSKKCQWLIFVYSLTCREDPLEKEMVTHSSILAWRIPWTEEPGGLQSTG